MTFGSYTREAQFLFVLLPALCILGCSKSPFIAERVVCASINDTNKSCEKWASQDTFQIAINPAANSCAIMTMAKAGTRDHHEIIGSFSYIDENNWECRPALIDSRFHSVVRMARGILEIEDIYGDRSADSATAPKAYVRLLNRPFTSQGWRGMEYYLGLSNEN